MVVQVQGADTPQQRAQSHAEDVAAHNLDQRWAVGIGLATIFAAFLQATIFIGQIIYLRQTVKEGRNAISAATRAAEAAEKSLAHAQAVSETELRPYVYVDETFWHWMHVPGDENIIMNWRYSIVWKNTGKIPAKRVVIETNHAAFPGEIPKDFDYPDLETDYQTCGSMGPGHSITNRTEISVDLIEKIWKGEERRYLWSWVEYDGFPGIGRHRSETCVEIRCTEDPRHLVATAVNAPIHGPFNGSDETAYQKPKT